MKRYYALTTGETSADLVIYNDIVTDKWWDDETSSLDVVNELMGLPETVTQLNVFINSYGGEVAAGLAIYNALRRHKAHVTTYCDGFACSAASVVFMAGNERVMGEASLLMIHNAWSWGVGNADELRKQADDLEKISDTAANAYRAGIKLSDEELETLLKAESWISPSEALEWGFATAIFAEQIPAAANMSARKMVFDKVLMREAVEPPAEPLAEERPEDEPKGKTYFNFGGKK